MRSVAQRRAERAADRLAKTYAGRDARRLADYLAENMGEIADLVRSAISESGLSLNELAKRTGVDDGVLSRFVRGERDITLATLERLAGELGLVLTFRRKRGRAGR